MIGVQGAVDDGRDHAFGVVGQERLFEDAFAGAGFAEHQAQTALLGMDAEDVEDFLLVWQQREGLRVEGIALQAEVGADHKLNFSWRVERFSVVGDGIEQTRFAHAFTLVINHHAIDRLRTLETNVDGAIRQVAWRFPAKRFERERVVGADVALLLDKEQLVVGLIGWQKANPLAIQRVAVQRTHAQHGMQLGVVMFLDPLRELAIERVERTQIQVAR